MTVAELIAALQKFDPTLRVYNEGCDCYVPSDQPEEDSSLGVPVIIITAGHE